MQGYGHDESVPYAWRCVRGKFRKAYMRFIVSRMHINLQNKWRIPIVNVVIYNVFNTASVGFGVCMDTKNMPPTACEMRVMGCKGTGFGVAQTLCV